MLRRDRQVSASDYRRFSACAVAARTEVLLPIDPLRIPCPSILLCIALGVTNTRVCHPLVEQHLRAQLELLQNHDANASDSRDSRGDDSPSSPGASANGYRELAAASHDAAARARAAKSEAELHIHPELRAQQMLEQQHSHDPSHNMMSMAAHAGHSPGSSPGGPSIAPAPSSSAPEVGSPGTGSKAKRELSQSKRAAQNRAAQVCDARVRR